MDLEKVKMLYLEEKLSTTDIAKKLGYSVSKVRYWLKKENCLRSRADGHKLSIPKMGKQSIGKKRVFTKQHKENMSLSALQRGENNAKGYYKNSNGYLEFTRGDLKGKMIHVFIMECLKGRKLKRNEVVHHKDGNKTNNSVYNLELMLKSEHSRLHAKMNYKDRKINNKGQLQ